MVVTTNPYGNGFSNNPWGRAGSIDSQRGDLWTLDLGEAQGLTASGGVLGLASILGIPTTNLIFYPFSVSLPDVGIAAENFQNTTGVNTPFPGADEAVPTVRITFRHEAATVQGTGTPTDPLNLLNPTSNPSNLLNLLNPFSSSNPLSPVSLFSQSGGAGNFASGVPGGSQIYGLLEAWKNLARAGRAPYGDESVPLLPSGNGYKPVYKFSVPLRFYAGMDSNSELVASSAYRLVNAWVRSIQMSEVSYDGNTLVTVSAQLCVDYFEPYTDQTVFSTSSGATPSLFSLLNSL